MATLLRIEPSLFRPDTEGWFIFDDGRKCLRRLDRQEASASITIMSDSIDPVKSMADGKTYDSKSALYRTYQPGGNPQGHRYECVGNQEVHNFTPQKRDRAKSIEAIKRAMGDL